MAKQASSHDDYVEVANEQRHRQHDLGHEVDQMIHQQDGALLVDIGAKGAEIGAQGAAKLAKDGHVRAKPLNLRRFFILTLNARPFWSHNHPTILMTL